MSLASITDSIKERPVLQLTAKIWVKIVWRIMYKKLKIFNCGMEWTSGRLSSCFKVGNSGQ